MPRRSSDQAYRRPRFDIYSVLLLAALVALIIACFWLYAEVAKYGETPFSGGPTVWLLPDRPAGLVLAESADLRMTLWQSTTHGMRIPIYG